MGKWAHEGKEPVQQPQGRNVDPTIAEDQAMADRAKAAGATAAGAGVGAEAASSKSQEPSKPKAAVQEVKEKAQETVKSDSKAGEEKELHHGKPNAVSQLSNFIPCRVSTSLVRRPCRCSCWDGRISQHGIILDAVVQYPLHLLAC
jgi:hypothetical protein